MKNKQKGFSTLLGLLLFIVLAGGGLYLYTEKASKEMPETNSVSTTTQKKKATVVPPKETPVACTMDARQCPDGTYVGRTGPNCEFVCPATPNKEKLTSVEALKILKENTSCNNPKEVELVKLKTDLVIPGMINNTIIPAGEYWKSSVWTSVCKDEAEARQGCNGCGSQCYLDISNETKIYNNVSCT